MTAYPTAAPSASHGAVTRSISSVVFRVCMCVCVCVCKKGGKDDGTSGRRMSDDLPPVSEQDRRRDTHTYNQPTNTHTHRHTHTYIHTTNQPNQHTLSLSTPTHPSKPPWPPPPPPHYRRPTAPPPPADPPTARPARPRTPPSAPGAVCGVELGGFGVGLRVVCVHLGDFGGWIKGGCVVCVECVCECFLDGCGICFGRWTEGRGGVRKR
jgi:hypothetical protein